MRFKSHCRTLWLAGIALVLAGAGSPDPGSLISAAKDGDVEALRELVRDGADVGAAQADGTTALHWAAHRDAVEAVKLLVEAGADVNAANDLGATALWLASENGSAPVVELLLREGADPNLSLLEGETPLMVASRAGNPAVTELLLRHGADPDATGPREQTALMWAAAAREPDIVALLVEHGADVHARSEVWRQFLAHGPHSHPRHQRWFEQGGNTALMFAARSGDLASVKHLVAAGAEVDDTGAWGVSVLSMAAYSDFGTVITPHQIAGAQGGPFYLGGEELRPGEFGEIVEFLLEQGADPNLGAEEFTALHAAVMRQNEETVELLLEHGADPELPLGAWTPMQRVSNTDFYFHRGWVGATPTWLAARFGTPKILHALVDHGADPDHVHRGVFNAGGDGGRLSERLEEVTTPLMAAVGMSRTGRSWAPPPEDDEAREEEILERVKLLVELGVDVNAVDAEGRTALDGAEGFEYDRVVEFLRAAGGKRGEELR